MSDQIVDGRRARGDASRRSVLSRATHLASVEGLDGLTIGHLAETSGHSKSSIATLFGSKQSLQLATIAAAREVFMATIVEPARTEPRGLRRLAVLMRNGLAYSRDRVFTGGCFFAATSADIDSKPGPVRDAVRTAQSDWYGYIAAQVRYAIEAGELTADPADAEDIAFELVALDEHANNRSLLLGDDRAYDVAARAMRRRLIAAGASEKMLAPLQ
ncbi:TetR family transcriptional regulator C-terminal domain-containing protein [Microbacterium sp. NPDC056234]|uniref:TetR family transcriptional regulator C-terminal domain-containing protein n=1 Tax=Microbacterium sp. NPDC056234 TaxID=3345757 RepID=UPI0035E2B913